MGLKIDLVNVQAIGEAHIEIGNNSICEFVGNNSNGKSILCKVLEYLTKGDLIHRDVREALIKDNTQSAVILITVDNRQIGVVLQHELRDCVMMYVPDVRKESEEGGKILRPLSDSDGCQLMLKSFGFRTYSKGDICLQLAPTFGAIPFVTTGGGTNGDIVNDITVDKVADEFLKSFASITFPTFKGRVNQLKREKEHIQTILDNMESYDWRQYESIADRMKSVYDAIAPYKEYKVSNVPIPYLEIIPVSQYDVRSIPVVEVYDYCTYVNFIGKELLDYVEICNGKCPTCGRPLFNN